MRFFAVRTMIAVVMPVLAGCGPNYSPDTYATNAAQQANKVDAGVIVGVRPVQISAQGTVGGVAGAAAGGIAGSQVGGSTGSAFGAIGGSVIGGLAGVAAEHIVGDANGFEYVVRKVSGELVSVAQKDVKPLRVGLKVLVIAGAQARIVPDYTVAPDEPASSQSGALPSGASPSGAPPPVAAVPPAHPPASGASSAEPPVIVAPTQLPTAFGKPPVPIITPSPESPASKP